MTCVHVLLSQPVEGATSWCETEQMYCGGSNAGGPITCGGCQAASQEVPVSGIEAAAPRPVMFRAGGPQAGPVFDPGLMSTPVTRFADISEFQPNISDGTYVRSFSKAIVIRAMYGDAHDDGAWYGGARRADLWKAGIKWLGIYQYLTDFQDAAAQAHAFVNLLGHIADGEVPICDLEEGNGDQDPRWHAWRDVVMAAWPQLAKRPANGQPQLYSGENFAATHNLSPGWIAAYQQNEPSPSHWAWQFTDAQSIPGIGQVDCSLAHATIDTLASWAAAGSTPPPPPPPPPPPSDHWTDDMVKNLPNLHEGESDSSGHWDIHTLQGLLCARNFPVTIDGVFGPGTTTAVRALQKNASVTADPAGVVGYNTWAAALNVATPT
jgi:GH25 family lysozyme M1 (1,4-beta-N-acetylmuramidase)